jgi:phage gpG-like protein
VKVEVEQKGAGKAALDLHGLGLRARDVRPCANKIGRIVAQSNKRRFESRGQGRWPKLDPATVEQKAQAGQDPRILRRSGRLYRSLTDPKPLSTRPDALAFGTDVRYARFADKGTKNEPARKLIYLQTAEQRRVTEIVSSYIAKAER